MNIDRQRPADLARPEVAPPPRPPVPPPFVPPPPPAPLLDTAGPHAELGGPLSAPALEAVHYGLPGTPVPDTGKTWGDPSFTRPLNFGHHPGPDGQLFTVSHGRPCWADTGTALTSDQWQNMPAFQQAALGMRLQDAGTGQAALAAFEQEMRLGDAARARVPQPETPVPGASPTPGSPLDRSAGPSAGLPADLPQGVRDALAGKFDGQHGGQCKVFVERQFGASFPHDISAKSMIERHNHPGFAASQEPRPGDIFVAGRGKWGHTGIVKAVHADGSLTVVDANHVPPDGETVATHEFPASYVRAYMLGYLRPNGEPQLPYRLPPL